MECWLRIALWDVGATAVLQVIYVVSATGFKKKFFVCFVFVFAN